MLGLRRHFNTKVKLPVHVMVTRVRWRGHIVVRADRTYYVHSQYVDHLILSGARWSQIAQAPLIRINTVRITRASTCGVPVPLATISPCTLLLTKHQS